MVMTVTPGSSVYCFIESDGRPWILAGDRWAGGAVREGGEACRFPTPETVQVFTARASVTSAAAPARRRRGSGGKGQNGRRSELFKRKKFLDAARMQNAVNNFLKYSWTPCFIHF